MGVSLCLIGLIGIVYTQVRHFGFVFLDDHVYVVENPQVLGGLTLRGVNWAFTTGTGGNWHPLTWLSHMTDVTLFGSDSGGHHLTSVGFHAANSLLLFAALVRLTGEMGKSAFIAALFAVHPLHVESVAWVSERKDVLSTLLWMLSIHSYITYAKTSRVRMLVLATVLFALGLMSKPMVVTLPFTLLLLDYWPLRRLASNARSGPASWPALIFEKLPMFALAALSAAITVKVQRAGGAVVALESLPLGVRLGNALVSYVMYVRDLVWPAKLAAFYPFHAPAVEIVSADLTALMLVCAGVVWQRRARPYLLVGWAWFLGNLIPAIGVVQVGDQARADRYTYVPIIGLLIIAAWGVSEIAGRLGINKRLLEIAAVSVVAAFTAASVRQAAYWRSNLSLFARATSVTTGNYRAEALLGVALADSGQYVQAIQHYNASLKIRHDNAEVYSNLGAALSDMGNREAALNAFRNAVHYKPSSPVFHYNFGVLLSQKGQTGEAINEIRTASQLDPANRLYTDALTTLTASAK